MSNAFPLKRCFSATIVDEEIKNANSNFFITGTNVAPVRKNSNTTPDVFFFLKLCRLDILMF